MSTYSQWARSRPLRRVTWVCGPEAVLRREVVDHYSAQLSGLAIRDNLHLSGVDESQLWDRLLQSPPSGGRLTLVRGAERVTMTGRMGQLIAVIPELSYVVFVSDEADFARVPGQPGSTAAEKPQLAPHLAAIQASRNGQLVRCAVPADEEKLLTLVTTWWPGAGLNFAVQVRDAAGGTLEAVYQACEVARRAGLSPDEQGLGLAVQLAPHARFADLVIAGRRREAAEAARFLSGSETLSVLGLLSWRLGVLQQLTVFQARGWETDEIARKGIDRHQQRQLAPHAAAYDSGRVLKCRQVLALAEDARRSGASVGVLEAVACLW